MFNYDMCNTPYQYQNMSTNLLKLYKILLNGKVEGIRKFSSVDSLDKIRNQIKTDLTDNFFFCMQDETKIMRSDEKNFSIQEITYSRDSINLINLKSESNSSSQSTINNNSVSNTYSNHKDKSVNIQISNIIPTKVYEKPQNINFNNISKINEDQKFLGIKTKQPKLDIESEFEKLKPKVYEDSSTDKKKIFQDFKGEKELSLMSEACLNSLLRSLDDYYLEDLKNICRVNQITHSGKNKDELIQDIRKMIRKYKKNFEDSSTDKKKFFKDFKGEKELSLLSEAGLNSLLRSLDDYYLDDLKDICRVNLITHSGKTKDELIKDIRKMIRKYKKNFQNEKEKERKKSIFEQTNDLLNLTNDELREILKKGNIAYSGLNKEELIKKIITNSISNKYKVVDSDSSELDSFYSDSD